MHRGEGLHFAPARQATADALRPSAGSGNAWALAQRFVAPQLEIDDRPFYIRRASIMMLMRPRRGVPWLLSDERATADTT